MPPANPPPAFVAGSEASDLISTELGRRVDVSPSALVLLNEFLDHVLYSIVSTSRSVGLGQLRSAVPLVLKPRLGKAALKVAEEELRDYMDDEEAEDLYSGKNSVQPKHEFDADLVWKLARLRCMVYARMGDLEEEDEEEWLEKEQLLDQTSAAPNIVRSFMTVTPTAAIFLTSIIEYLGEQALYYAAQYAQKRHDTIRSPDSSTTSPEPLVTAAQSDFVLEGKDMNHVGRDSPLSRLWRSWRRQTRSAENLSGPISPIDSLSPAAGSVRSQMTSSCTQRSISPILEQRQVLDPSSLTPSQIPLPMSENDIDEIEGHPLAAADIDSTKTTRRRSSMPSISGKLTGGDLVTSHDAPEFQERSPPRPKFERNRSNSLPAGQSRVMSGADSLFQTQMDDARVSDERGATQKQNCLSAEQESTSSPPDINTSMDSTSCTVHVVNGHGHRKREGLKPIKSGDSDMHPESQPNDLHEPLTSASIKGPGDFDMMYEPKGRPSPKEKHAQRSRVPELSLELDPYQELVAQQLEEHKRYSQHSHEMKTPSIYSKHQHSPRFPRDTSAAPTDVDSASKTEKAQRASSHATPSPEPGTAISSYVPTPESGLVRDDQGHYSYGASSGQTRQRQADSPVSQMSGKYPTRRYSTNEQVPDLPQQALFQSTPVEDAPTTRSRSHSKSSSSSSRLLGFTRDVLGKPHSIYQQRATGGMSDEMRRAHSSTPDGWNDRPATARSSASSNWQHLRVRADSDNNGLKTSSKAFTTERSLEILINSDETLHYTLTPATANFRDADVSFSFTLSSPWRSLTRCQINPPFKRTQTQDLADFFRNTAPPGQENIRPPSARSRKTSLSMTRTAQALPATRGPVPSTKDMARQDPPKRKTKNPVGEPRDARVGRVTSLRDLADYVRSTGPSNEEQLPKAFVGRSMTSAAQRPVERAMSTPAAETPPTTPPKPQYRLKLQARDPRPSRHAEPSDLVDFIREGPPPSQDEQHDQPTHSFRWTADSDDLSNANGSLPKASIDTNGIHSIADSQSPLLDQDSKAGAQPASSFAQQVSQVESNGKSQNKTARKPKDPYPLDDDNDDLVLEQPAKKRNEESLLDFLRNTGPPAGPSATPGSPVTAPDTNGMSNNERRNEAGRATKNATPFAAPVKGTQAQARARAESPHLTQTGSKLDSYRPTQATHASHVDRNRAKSKPRSEVSVNGGSKRGVGETADLAEYLRSTGPTPAQEGWTQPLVYRPVNGYSGNGGLKKLFSVRGKK